MTRSMTVRHRTPSCEHDRDRSRGRLRALSPPLVVLMFALLSMSACSKDRGDGAQGKTENKQK